MARPNPLLREVARGARLEGHALTAELIDSAQEHRMAGVLLANLDRDGAPHDLVMRLEALDMSLAAYQRGLIGMAGRIHHRLEEAGIEHLFFKGLIEAHRTFPTATQRPFSDIDISLAPGTSLSRASALLAPDHRHVDELDHLAATGQMTAMSLQVDGFPVDLHSEPLRVGRRLQDPHLWWQRTTTVEIPSIGPVRALDREASLTVFLLHQARDRFRYLIGVPEFRFHLQRGIDWDMVEMLARAEGVWDQVIVAAEVMSSLAGVSGPVVASRTARVWIWRTLWGPRVRLKGPEGKLHHSRRGVWLMPLLARGRFLQSVGWIGRSLFPPDAVLRIRHPHDEGPYWWRLSGGRLRRWVQRRLRSAQMRS